MSVWSAWARRAITVVVVRSTVPPGNVQNRLFPILKQNSHRQASADFGVCMKPEFLREGSAIDEYTLLCLRNRISCSVVPFLRFF